MASEKSPSGELRELIYIDNESVNGHLSSMGVGLETGIDESSGSVEGGRARFFGNINVPGLPLGLGGEGEKYNEETEDIQKQIDITVPYRLQTLREVIETSESTIKNPDEEGVGPGDVVEVTGTVEPMSLFRFELTEDVIIRINEATNIMTDALAEIRGVSPNELAEEDQDAEEDDGNVVGNEAFLEASKKLNNKRVPIRIDTEGGNSFGALLNRKSMTVPETHAFSRPRKYTIFARVERRIGNNESWEPTDTLRLGKHFTNMTEELEDFSDDLKSAAAGHGVKMDDKHVNMDGPGKIVHPIAVYW
ncbi:DUF6414 family protein [Halococcus qingdaonensis]|uniref:DUF6414 family protein n=1 Tax=Halococcus qingdaonensis TaxID=224402 RepID=UPI0021161101|nr:hypothetical protein [Halococcus qingdaonensis]